MKKIWFSFPGILVLLQFITGCASDIGEAARKAGVSRIAIDPRIVMHGRMRMGYKAQTGDAIAETASDIVNSIYSKRISEVSTKMHQNGIDISKMVNDSAATVLGGEKGIDVPADGADAVLVIHIKQHGFDDSGLSMTHKVPFIALRGELIRDRKQVWTGNGEATPMRAHGLGARWQDYYADPELLRKHWQIQIERALRELFMVREGSKGMN
jgi:hypothetical protein